METKHRNSLLPFAIITFIYFIVGFLTTVNEQLQAPLKFTFLAEAGSLKTLLQLSSHSFSFWAICSMVLWEVNGLMLMVIKILSSVVYYL